MSPILRSSDDNEPATKGDLRKLAQTTKADLKKFATKDDLKRFATKEDLKRFATKENLKRFATKKDLIALETRIGEKFATKDALEEFRLDMANLFMEVFKRFDQMQRNHEALVAELRSFRVDVERRFSDFAADTPTKKEHKLLDRRVTHLEQKTGYRLN